MGRRRHHRPYTRVAQRPHGQTRPVQRQRHGADPGGGVQRRVLRAAGVLDTQGVLPARVEHEPQQGHRLGDPGDHHQPLRGGGHAPAPGEQFGERGAQPGQSARVGVAERVVGQFREHPALRGGPRGAREQRQVGCAGDEVGAGAGGAGSEITRAWRSAADRGPHPGPRAAAAVQIPLRRQLLVRLGHQPARHPQIGGEIPARRQPGPPRQPPRTDRLPQRGPQRTSTRACGRGGDRQQQLPGGGPGRGPLAVHGRGVRRWIGPRRRIGPR